MKMIIMIVVIVMRVKIVMMIEMRENPNLEEAKGTRRGIRNSRASK